MRRTDTLFVLADPGFERVGVTGVEAVVRASEKVGPEYHRLTVRPKKPFDKLRANGGR